MVKRHKNWSWLGKKGKYLVELGIRWVLLNALVHFTVSSDLPRSPTSKLEIVHDISNCASIFLNL